jgi:hypothetical protein
MLLSRCGKTETDPPVASPHEDRDDRVLFFFDADCPDCRLVKHELLPLLLEEKLVPGAEVVYLDVAIPSTLEVLRRLESVLRFEASIMAPIVVVGRQAYCGVAEIERELACGDLPASESLRHR